MGGLRTSLESVTRRHRAASRLFIRQGDHFCGIVVGIGGLSSLLTTCWIAGRPLACCDSRGTEND